MKKIYLSIIVLLLVVAAQAQVPQAFSYQAVIRNSSNALVANQTVSERISLLKDSATGTVVYSETQSAKTNANGLVSLQIGTGSVLSGSFSGINWGAGVYFIKIETDPSGGNDYSISNTTQLLSVPYALQAGSAPSLEYPDGVSNITTVFIDSLPYIVPVGKNFYYTGSSAQLAIPQVGTDTINLTSSSTLFVAGSTQTIISAYSSSSSPSIITGFIVDKIVEVVYKNLSNGSYTVPNGKTLFLFGSYPLTTNQGEPQLKINGNLFHSVSPTPAGVSIFSSGTTFSGQGIIIDGYLK